MTTVPDPNPDNHTRQLVAATLAAAMIARSTMPISAVEAHEAYIDCLFAVSPNPGVGRYEEWKKRRDAGKLKAY